MGGESTGGAAVDEGSSRSPDERFRHGKESLAEADGTQRGDLQRRLKCEQVL